MGIPDPITIEEHYEEAPNEPYGPTPVLGYMGTDGALAEKYASMARALGWKTTILCRPENKVPGSITWEEDTWKIYFKTFDILMAPQRPEFPAKSPAKVIQALGCLVPVLASPVPSYASYVQEGVNGYLCHNDAEWAMAFRFLKSSQARKALRDNIIEFGESPDSVSRSHSLWAITSKWYGLFMDLRNQVKYAE
jgi:glycosyltransferase involved in cell wall biosynthesis